MSYINPRFYRRWTNAGGEVEAITDEMAMRLLKEQYGEVAGLQIFIDLARGVAKCSSGNGPFMIEFRGPHFE